MDEAQRREAKGGAAHMVRDIVELFGLSLIVLAAFMTAIPLGVAATGCYFVLLANIPRSKEKAPDKVETVG